MDRTALNSSYTTQSGNLKFRTEDSKRSFFHFFNKLLNEVSSFRGVQYTPYRQLDNFPYKGGWRVRLSGGEQWFPKQSEELKTIQAKTFADAENLYNKVCRQLLDEGWKLYNSFEPW